MHLIAATKLMLGRLMTIASVLNSPTRREPLLLSEFQPFLLVYTVICRGCVLVESNHCTVVVCMFHHEVVRCDPPCRIFPLDTIPSDVEVLVLELS